jgi:hypothetical protein
MVDGDKPRIVDILNWQLSGVALAALKLGQQVWTPLPACGEGLGVG